MTNKNILIIEDDLQSQRLLVENIQKIRPDWEIVHIACTVSDSVNYLNSPGNQEPDLIFAEIRLSDGTSFDIYSQVNIALPVIFTSVNDKYALQAFTVNCIDYLIKPINRKMLEKSIQKYERNSPLDRRAAEKILHESVKQIINANLKKYRKRFLIQHGKEYLILGVNDIAYIYYSNRFVFARTFSGHEHLLDLPLEKLKNQLSPDNFFRVNRRTIVNAIAIKKIRPYFNGGVKIITEPPFPEDLIASREKAKLLKDWLGQ